MDGHEPPPYAAPLATGDDSLGARRGPRQVRWAANLMLVNGAFGLLALVVALVTPLGDYRATVARLDNSLTAEQVVSLAATVQRYHAGEALVILLANVALSVAVRRGINWARIATFLLTGTELVLVLAGGSAGQGAAALLLASIVIDIAILVLLAGKPSRVYFAAARGRAGLTQPVL